MPDEAPKTTIGLPAWQEPKYTTDGRAIINRASGEAIPADEPVFVFRARDRHALAALREYLSRCEQAAHVAVIEQRIEDFQAFARRHPERMKEPDTEVFPP